MARRYRQGIFKPLNPKKYMGDPTNIVYRSGWELKFLKHLDTNPTVIGYASEEIVIPYLSPVDNKMHRYFVDMLVVAKKPDGSKKVSLIEIKPWAQTQVPKSTTKKKQSAMINEVTTYVVNKAKWAAAEAYCAKKGWEFIILTEKDINFV